MDPDKAHEEYFKTFEGHNNMSPETKIVVQSIKESIEVFNVNFKEHAKEDAVRFKEISEKISENNSLLNTQVATLIEKVDGINKRLDVTNGRIAKNEALSSKNETDIKVLMTKFSSVLSETHDIAVLHRKEREKKSKWVEWAVKSVAGIFFGILGALLLAILKVTHIINL